MLHSMFQMDIISVNHSAIGNYLASSLIFNSGYLFSSHERITSGLPQRVVRVMVTCVGQAGREKPTGLDNSKAWLYLQSRTYTKSHSVSCCHSKQVWFVQIYPVILPMLPLHHSAFFPYGSPYWLTRHVSEK